MSKTYDLIVIGAGSAGLSVSLSMNEFGFKVLLIDKKAELIGGDCLNFGCIPSKALIHIAREVHSAKKAEKFGLKVGGEVDIHSVLQYIKGKQDIIRSHENKEYLIEQGLAIEIGEAHFISKHEVEVNGKRFAGKKVIIATGSKPAMPNVFIDHEAPIVTNETLFDIQNLPKQLVVIGGGPNGLELGQAFHRLGSKVTIVHRHSRILNKEEYEISEILYQRLKDEGVQFMLDSEPKAIKQDRVDIKTSNGNVSLKCDLVLVAVGRELNHHDLKLENAEVKVSKGEIVTNNKLQTTNPDVYVCGDALGSLKFSHAAEMHARLLLNNFFSPFKKKLSYQHFSWVTFTDPEIATFGRSSAQLQEAGESFERLEYDFKDDDRAVVGDYRYGKLVLNVTKTNLLNRSPKILGGTIIAPGAGELIQELVTHMVIGAKLSVLFDKIYAYPVASRVNQAVALQKQSEQLTTFVKRLLQMLY
ncbi:FAD-binding protein [Fulvivirga sp. RKSG066]|uniref:FAD-dependent oxidoreductase n=1 Tax=Fulvivirga aurantia TaxID=2529383 RepID=UPI0012BD4D32|nr:FAD-binding protein [Fulvivirga aurantia]